MESKMHRRDSRRISGEERRLVAMRYLILITGAGMLAWLTAQFVLGGGVSAATILKIGFAAIAGPALYWSVSEKEVSLLNLLATSSNELRQRTTEITALNRMVRSHLAECQIKAQAMEATPMYAKVATQRVQFVVDGQRGRDEDSWIVLGPTASVSVAERGGSDGRQITSTASNGRGPSTQSTRFW